jgi:hypothetical protein
MGWASRAEKQAARKVEAAASRKYNALICAVKQEAAQAEDAAITLVYDRSASFTWLCPRLNASLKNCNAKFKLHIDTSSLFEGLSEGKLKALWEKLRRCFPSRGLSGDKTTFTLAVTAVLLKGIQELDKLGWVPIPALHGTVADAISHMPIDGADHVAHAFGWFDSMPMLDLLNDFLLISAAARMFFNRRAAQHAWERAQELDQHTDKLMAEALRYRTYRDTCEGIRANQEEVSYQAFKAMIAMDALCQSPREWPEVVRQKITRHFVAACQQWWSVLQVAPSAL